MISPEQVKSFITHPELFVANAAIEYFAESNLYEKDATLMPLVLQRLRGGEKGEAYHLFHASRFVQTEDTVREMIALATSPSTNPNTIMQLMQILIHCDPAMLEPYEDAFSKSSEFRNMLQQRKEIRAMSNEALFSAFEKFLQDACGKTVDKIGSSFGDVIVEELARRKCLSEEHILHELDSFDPHIDFGYDVIYYTKLAGEQRITAAIPTLCNFLWDEDDLLPEASMHALVRIGTDDVITSLTAQYTKRMSEKDAFGLFAAGVFGRIKTPGSEAALLSLLPHEENVDNATSLAQGLCELGSVRGIPLVRKMVLEGGYNSGILDLKESLYAHCVIAGEQLPELEAWKLDWEKEARQRSQNSLAFSAHAPVVRVAAEKIGRNDPCPCGSGKKYKKCCGSN